MQKETRSPVTSLHDKLQTKRGAGRWNCGFKRRDFYFIFLSSWLLLSLLICALPVGVAWGIFVWATGEIYSLT